MINTNTEHGNLSKEVHDILTRSPYTRTYNALLAKALNRSKAVMINQIHYWIIYHQDDEHFYDGRYWIHESYAEWHEQFPEMTIRGIQKTLASLEADGYILVGNYNKKNYDRTKWYTINYEKVLDAIKKQEENNLAIEQSSIGIEKSSIAGIEQSSTWGIEQSSKPIPNISIPNNPNTNNPSNIPNHKWCNSDEIAQNTESGTKEEVMESIKERSYRRNLYYPSNVYDMIEYFFDRYCQYTCAKHPNIKTEQLRKVEKILDCCLKVLNVHGTKELINKYFETNFSSELNCDYKITHFCTRGIIKNRCYDCGYGDGIITELMMEIDKNIKEPLLRVV